MDALISSATRRRLAGLGLSLLLLAAPGRAEAEVEAALGGHVKGFLFQQLGDPWELDRAGARLQLAVRGGSGDLVSFLAAVDFELDSRLLTTDQPVRRGEGLDIYPVETYLNLSKGPLEIRLGQQFIFWGRTTWVTPTDVITAWDYPDMASEIEDYRLAPLALRVSWYLVKELMLDLVWLPLFVPSRLGSTLPESLGGLPVQEGEPALPEHHIKNGELGLRLSQSVSELALDWAVAAYKGFEKMPLMELRPSYPAGATSGPPEALLLIRRYDPLWMVGADLAKALGPLVVKAEVALKITDDWQGQDPLVRNSRVEAVAGVDYLHSDRLELGLQYISRTYLSFHPRQEREAILAAGGTPPDFTEKAQAHEVLLHLSLKLTDELGAQLIGLYSVTDQDFFVLAFAWWEIADALRASVGGVGFGGVGSQTPLARQKESSRLFVEVKYSF